MAAIISQRVSMAMELPGDVLVLSQAFKAAGFPLYVVGGAVRDAAMGKSPKDFDVATSAPPDQVLELLEPIREVSTDLAGKAFGVVRARFDAVVDELHRRAEHQLVREYEIATFRQDLTEGRHPVVRYSTIEEDVKRRDFTINALFYDIQAQEVVDLVGGLDDIRARAIRTVGEPRDRFREDRLRIMRALRFASTLGFQIDTDTLAAIREDSNLSSVSPERIRIELVRAIEESRDLDGFLCNMDDTGMWAHALPGLEISNGKIEHGPAHVVLALLLRLNDPELLAKQLACLKYSGEEIAKVTCLLRVRREVGLKSPWKLRRAFQRSGLAELDLREFAAQWPFARHRALEAFYAYLGAPPVSGDDLLAQGYSGQALGEELERREAGIFGRLVGA